MADGAIVSGTWTNWAGNVRATPRTVVTPGSITELRAAVIEAARREETVRVVGAGHSFAPLCVTNGTLLDLSRLVGVERVDATTGEVTIWAGTRIADLGEPLLAQGRALANQGDIDRQAIAGAVSTGTHGTGRKHGSFSAAVRAVELMRPDGELVTIDTTEPFRLRAASLSLGLLGVLTRVTLATVPAYKLREQTQVLPFADCLDGFLLEETSRRNAEFWWLPAHDRCVLKTFVETEETPFRVEAPEALPGTIERYLKPDAVDWSWRIYPSTRSFPFVEMEYTLPLAGGPAVMRDVRRLMQTRHPDCTWAVEYRTQPGEQSLLGPTRGRESVTISLHQATHLPYEPLFRGAEAIFRSQDGRPHWGKLHFLNSDEVAHLYPELPAFRAIRTEMDPKGMFTNDYLARLGLAGDTSAPAC
ncbi:MAG: FAD-linked oxidoreductase [Thermomicrobiales bacterium]|nr:FAD-linked oxidoreductase [Thermomicrobiales bacterium]